MSTSSQTQDFIPVLLGSDVNVYGMARSFHEAYGIPSVAIGKGHLGATSNSRIVSVKVVEPNLEDDAVFATPSSNWPPLPQGADPPFGSLRR